MNILSHQEMISREKELLHLYNHGDIKFKLNLQQLIQYKTNKKDLFCFTQPDENTQILLQKLVPLRKKVKMIKLEEEQNGFFKVLGYIFLLIIYKRKDQSGEYFKQHLKCSLYSSDFDLLQVRNHSFNKKMKSDTIKSAIATLFKEIQYLMQTAIVKINKIKPQEMIAFALQQNDIVVEGFHLFYRSILARLDVENANNCIEDVNPQQALEHLIEYFELDCRVFDSLYFFNQAGVFITLINEEILTFGSYYENQLHFQQTSDEETQPNTVEKTDQLKLNLPKKLISNDTQIQKEDVKIFNFLLDTDRNSSCMEQSFPDNKSQQNVTPSFQHNEELKFGRKTERSIQNSLNKIKDRIQNQRINEISSEQQEIHTRQEISQSFNGDLNNKNSLQNRFLNLQLDDSRSISEVDGTDGAPTPILGGNQVFRFAKIDPPPKIKEIQKDIRNNQLRTPEKTIQNYEENSRLKNNVLLIQTKDIKKSAIRRQSYQGENSSQSKSSDNIKKAEMKTSKNQIQVIDQTASRVSLANDQDIKKMSQEVLNARKVTMAYCQQTSSFSNCTCHLQKRAKFKLSSQIISMSFNIMSQKEQTLQNFGRTVTNQSPLKLEKKINFLVSGNESKKLLFKTNSNKSTQNLKDFVKKQKSPTKQQKDHQKSQQFINFLKKDKTQLIKKLTERRNAKNQNGITQNTNNKFTQHNNNNQGDRRYVKQSMFVGSYNFQNPQKFMHNRLDKNRSISPHYSIDKNMKHKCEVRERSKTPNHANPKNQFKSQGIKLIPTSNKKIQNSSKQKQTAIGQYLSQGNIPHSKVNFVASNVQKPQISIKIPISPLNLHYPGINLTPNNQSSKGIEVSFKR